MNRKKRITNTTEDIFSFLDIGSLVRATFNQKINLNNYSLPLFSPDKKYTSCELTITEDQDTLDYHSFITEICKEGRHTGKHEKFHTGVSEAVRNAYQHGNRKEQKKKVTLSYKAEQDNFEVAVSDEGGELNANFVPFVLLHRHYELHTPVSFYSYALDAVRRPENAGIGTFVMHMVSDEVNYFKNHDGGLTVQLIIRKDSE